jgi:hypothetical protein
MNIAFILVWSLFLFDLLPCLGQDAAPQPADVHYADDHPFDFSSPEYGLDMDAEDIASIVHHPNGCIYSFSFAEIRNQSNWFIEPYLETTVHDLLTGQVFEDTLSLDIPGSSNFAFGEVHSDFIVSKDDDILVSFWVTAGVAEILHRSYLCLTRLNITEDTQRLEVKTERHEMEEEPEMIKVLSGDTDVYVWYLAEGRHYIQTFTVNVQAGWELISYEMVECAQFSTNVELSLENLILIRQSDSRTLNLSLLDRNLSPIKTAEVPMMVSSTGMDNFIHPVWSREEDAFFIFIYRDELMAHTYQDLELYRVSGDLELIGSMNLEIPESWTLNPSFLPILLKEHVFLIDAGLSGIASYSMDLDLLNISPLDPDLDVESIERSLLQVQYLDDQAILRCQVFDDDYGTFHFSFSIFEEGSIPYSGIFRPSEDMTFINTTKSYPCGLEIGPGQSLTAIDSKVIVAGDIYNYGKIQMTGSDLAFSGLDLEDARLFNFGNLTFVRSRANCVVESSGSLILEANDTSFLVSGLEIYQGDVGIKGVHLDRDYKHWISIQGSAAPPNLTFKDCIFDSTPAILENGEYHLELASCQVMGKVPAYRYPLEKVVDCTFIDCGRILLKGQCKITDSTFKGDSTYFNVEGPDVGASFTGCLFEGITTSLFEGLGGMNEEGGSFEFKDCSFKDDYIPFADHYGRFSRYIAEDCSFENCTEPLYLKDHGIRIVRNCTFMDNNVSISIQMDPEEDRGGGRTSITNNLFLNNNASIVIEGFSEDHLDRWYPDDDIFDKGRDFDLIDARNNSFDLDGPEQVAATMSRWIYFLPFYDRNGTLVHTEDEDMDGMDDSWERDHGLDPAFYFDRFADDDHDNYCSYEEFKYGTDPEKHNENPTTSFRVWLVAAVLCIFLITIPIVVFVFSVRPLLWMVKMHKFQGKFGEYEKVRREQFRGELRTIIKDDVVIPGKKVPSEKVGPAGETRPANIGIKAGLSGMEPPDNGGGGP